jgi:hypothetical protein
MTLTPAQRTIKLARERGLSLADVFARDEASDPNTEPKKLLALAKTWPDEVLRNPVLPFLAVAEPALWKEIRQSALINRADIRLAYAMSRATGGQRALWTLAVLGRAATEAKATSPMTARVHDMLRMIASGNKPLLSGAMATHLACKPNAIVEKGYTHQFGYETMLSLVAYHIADNCRHVVGRLNTPFLISSFVGFHVRLGEERGLESGDVAMSEREWMLGCLRGIQAEERKLRKEAGR